MTSTIHTEHLHVIPDIMNTSTSPCRLAYDIDWVGSMAEDIFDGVFDRTRLDLKKGRGAAYFWIACPKSDLYHFLDQVLETPPLPGRIAAAAENAEAIKAGGLPDVPLYGISSITINTNDVDQWYGAPKDMSAKVYADRIASLIDKLEYVEGAIINNVEVRISGRLKSTFERVLTTFLRARDREFETEFAATQAAEKALKKFTLGGSGSLRAR